MVLHKYVRALYYFIIPFLMCPNKEVVKLLACLSPPNWNSWALKTFHVHAHFCSLELRVVGCLAYSHSPTVSHPVLFTIRWSGVYLPWGYYSNEFLRCLCCRAIPIRVPWCWSLYLMCLKILPRDTLVWKGLARLLGVFVSCVDSVLLRFTGRKLCGGIPIADFSVLASRNRTISRQTFPVFHWLIID